MMEVYVFILTLVVLVSSELDVVHEETHVLGCSDTEEEFIYGLDGEVMFYADFNKQEGKMSLPEFADPVSFPEETYQAALANIQICKQNLDVCIQAYKSPQEKMDPPQTSIYPTDDVQQGVENALICHVTGFFPPPVKISWTKNNMIVTEDISLSQYYPNSDGTYTIFSTLKFVPVEGDMYSCSVNHKILPTPQTKTWDVEISLPGVGPAVFCGVGLTLGLLGVAAGTFFLIKGNNCN
ncbi:HLA class II histocompatibility antigen, DP alpha 1 chain [Paramisgurnus dabryanus]|uniref:HLA class II histocompatibility antigen, DP alpha 1 chain n=1 Tax=Paramisgurnus dabryanus TaxID=90735 RepID=UPI0031F417C8